MIRLIGITPSTPAGLDLARIALDAGLDLVVLRGILVPPNPGLPVHRVSLHVRIPNALERATNEGFGLHLPDGADVAGVRARFPGHLGASTHSVAGAQAALSAGADFVFLSPIFRATSKPEDARAPLGVTVLGSRTYALGGVTPENTGACVAAGAHGVAVMGGIFLAPDVAAAVRAYSDVLNAHSSGS